MLNVCDMQQFIKLTENLDAIVCYGAGQELSRFVEMFRETAVLEKCCYVIDQDKDKQGTTIEIGKKNFHILSPEEMKKRCLSSCAIVITCAKYSEILEIFEKDKIFKKIDYYCFSYFKLFEKEKSIAEKKIPLDLKKYKDPVIPKVIHYCWFGKSPIPDSYKRWMESWSRYCPDYEIKEWNETNYDVSKNKYMFQAYENKKWGFVPDYARLDILYQYGGIYLDTDVELISNLDDLLYQDGFVCFEEESRVNCGVGFGAVKGLEIIREMMEVYHDRSFVKRDGQLDLAPSPEIQTEFFVKKGLKLNGEYQIVDRLAVYPQKVMGSKSILTRKVRIFPETRAIHHLSGSWLGEETKLSMGRIEEGIRLADKRIGEFDGE